MGRRDGNTSDEESCCGNAYKNCSSFNKSCGWGWMFGLWIIVGVIACAVFIVWVIYAANPGANHMNASSHSNVVDLKLTSSHDELVVTQQSRFKKELFFDIMNATSITTNTATVDTLMLYNKTSGAFYDLDAVIEEALENQELLDMVLGMPELLIFLETYYNETLTLMRRRSITRGPDVVTFLYDTQNNITALQQQLIAVNSSFYANANYAYYASVSTIIPSSPATSLVALSASGTFAQQVGVILVSNTFSVTTAGSYMLAYNVAITQPAAAITETVSLLVGSSAVATSTLSWAGASTGQSSTSQTVLVTLGTTDVVKLSVTGSTTGATIYTPGTQVSIWNIS